jgi:hypothetical protein
MDWFALRAINFQVYGGKTDLPERVETFMQADPARRVIAKQKAPDWV